MQALLPTSERKQRMPALAELRTESMESQCGPSRIRRLESIICSVDNGSDLQQEIEQLLVRLGQVEFSDENLLSSAFSDLQTLWKISRQGPLGNLRLMLAELITEDDKLNVFQNTVKCISELKGDFQQHDELWKCIKHILCVMWNCTDISVKLCRKITDTGILSTSIQLLTEISKHDGFLDDDRKHFLVKAFLGVLHNSIRNCSESKEVFLRSGCLCVLPTLFSITSPMVKAKSLMVTSYLVNEHENAILSSSDETIAFIVQVLADSTKSKNHVSTKYGMNAVEIMKGLNNIAMNDANKVKLVAAGGLKLYTILMCSEDEDEREMAALGIWTLSFAADKTKIIQEPGLVEALKALTKSRNNTSSAHHARGALWELFNGQEKLEMSVESSVPHVMISYQWDAQKIMCKVKDCLTQSGFKVWMDVEHMSGSTLEAMALAVERAAVVVICMSEKYKASPSCRTESEYIFRLRKDIIPLRLQSGYRPDGWLGILVGTRLYFDFNSEEHVSSNIPKLIKELGNRGKIHVPVARGACANAVNTNSSSDTPDSLTEMKDTHPLVRRLSRRNSSRETSRDSAREAAIEQWSHGDVVKWLNDHRLSHYTESFSAIDGNLLLEMRRVRKAAPEFFYRTLQHDLHMDLASALKFSQLLGRLL